MKVEGAITVITGAANGMGRALAVDCARRGAKAVAICDINDKDLEETAQLVRAASVLGPQRLLLLQAHVDVTNRQQVEKFRDDVINLDKDAPIVLFNNAGIAAIGKIVLGKDDDPVECERIWDRCFNVDFWGVVIPTRAFLPNMISRKAGHIVNTSSVNSFFTWPEHSCYTAAKHAVAGFTTSLMIDLSLKAPHIKCSNVMPGGVKTRIALDMEHTGGDLSAIKNLVTEQVFDLTSEEASEWILNAVERNDTRILVGYDAFFLDKMTRLFPHSQYGFYRVLGELGLDATKPEHLMESLREKVGVLDLPRLMWNGMWIPTTFVVLPMIPFKLRRYVSPTTLAAGAAVVMAAKMGMGSKL